MNEHSLNLDSQHELAPIDPVDVHLEELQKDVKALADHDLTQQLALVLAKTNRIDDLNRLLSASILTKNQTQTVHLELYRTHIREGTDPAPILSEAWQNATEADEWQAVVMLAAEIGRADLVEQALKAAPRLTRTTTVFRKLVETFIHQKEAGLAETYLEKCRKNERSFTDSDDDLHLTVAIANLRDPNLAIELIEKRAERGKDGTPQERLLVLFDCATMLTTYDLPGAEEYLREAQFIVSTFNKPSLRDDYLARISRIWLATKSDPGRLQNVQEISASMIDSYHLADTMRNLAQAEAKTGNVPMAIETIKVAFRHPLDRFTELAKLLHTREPSNRQAFEALLAEARSLLPKIDQPLERAAGLIHLLGPINESLGLLDLNSPLNEIFDLLRDAPYSPQRDTAWADYAYWTSYKNDAPDWSAFEQIRPNWDKFERLRACQNILAGLTRAANETKDAARLSTMTSTIATVFQKAMTESETIFFSSTRAKSDRLKFQKKFVELAIENLSQTLQRDGKPHSIEASSVDDHTKKPKLKINHPPEAEKVLMRQEILELSRTLHDQERQLRDFDEQRAYLAIQQSHDYHGSDGDNIHTTVAGQKKLLVRQLMETQKKVKQLQQALDR